MTEAQAAWRSITDNPPPVGMDILAREGEAIYRSERIASQHPDDADYYVCMSGQPCAYRPEPEWWLPLSFLPDLPAGLAALAALEKGEA